MTDNRTGGYDIELHDRPLLPNQEAYFRGRRIARVRDGRATGQHAVVGIDIEGTLDWPALHGVFGAVMHRHEALRTSFRETQTKPLAGATHGGAKTLNVTQSIHAGGSLKLSIDQLRDVGASDANSLQAIIDDCVSVPFDYASAPLLRLGVTRISPSRHLALLVVPAVVCDDRSASIIARDCVKFYAEWHTRGRIEDATRSGAYAQLIERDRILRTTTAFDESLAYWKNRLDDCRDWRLTVADFPLAVPPSIPGVSFRPIQTEELNLTSDDVHQLQCIVRSRDMSLEAYCLACFACAVARHTCKTRIPVSVCFANRAHDAAATSAVAPLANTHVLGIDCAEVSSATGFLQEVQSLLDRSRAHQGVSPYRVGGRLGWSERGAKGVSVSFAFDDSELHDALQYRHEDHVVSGRRLRCQRYWNQFCQLNVDVARDTIKVTLTYAGDMLRQDMTRRLLGRYADELFDGDRWTQGKTSVVR